MEKTTLDVAGITDTSKHLFGFGDMKVLRDLLLVDPDTGDPLIISSNLAPDRTFATFQVTNPKSGAKWRHTIHTEEV